MKCEFEIHYYSMGGWPQTRRCEKEAKYNVAGQIYDGEPYVAHLCKVHAKKAEQGRSIDVYKNGDRQSCGFKTEPSELGELQNNLRQMKDTLEAHNYYFNFTKEKFAQVLFQSIDDIVSQLDPNSATYARVIEHARLYKEQLETKHRHEDTIAELEKQIKEKQF